ncbi:MAG: Nif3-like dinuclear metal center hexameric protein [Coriobacteriales bacterium]|jgi:putative NIF3 family GTP cyclohydrolase 1 type 2|nr:Nif3-like dinuclear metal center hexameric protein [Coriobacteriales bacterium]
MSARTNNVTSIRSSQKKSNSKNAELTVRELEQLLFAAFPATDALEDDRIGLLVGEAHAQVGSIALALDASVDAIEVAATYGCNVLVTHHPVFWNAPSVFLREASACSPAGSAEAAAVYRAAEQGVALIGMHTNLDCAPAAAGMLLEPVGYEYRAPLAYPAELGRELSELADAADAKKSARAKWNLVRSGSGASKPVAGLGQLGVPCKAKSAKVGARTGAKAGTTAEAKAEAKTSAKALSAKASAKSPAPAQSQTPTLKELAQRYEEVFGAVARVWGDEDMPIEVLATCSGGGGELVRRVIASGASCYVTGEVRYHEALELAAAGVALIELGHDRSELPYRFYLRDALLKQKIAQERIFIIEPLVSWWQPWRTEL